MIITLIAQALVAGGLSGARPLLSLLVLGLAARFTYEGALTGDVAWIVDTYGLLVLAGLSYLEHEVRDDPDMEELLRWPLGALGTVCGVLAARLIAATSGESDAIASGATSWLAAAGAAVASIGIQTARRRALEALDDFASLEGWWRRVEAGGVVGTLVLIWALPFLAIGFVVLLTVGAVVIGYVSRRWQQAEDARRRRPCPQCQTAIREEATRCPSCRAEVEPVAWLTA
jgi:hypothetical protein